MRILVTILSFAISLILLLLLGADSHAQTYKWVRGGGTDQLLSLGGELETSKFMCTDPNGNVYALSKVGINAVTADTFYWPGGIGSSQSILFTSHNCEGQMRFAKLITGTGNEPHGIVADDNGNVYVAFQSSHSGTNPLRIRHDTEISAHWYNQEAFVKYDTAGDLKWIRFIGLDEYATYLGTGLGLIALDGAQNPHLVAFAKQGVRLSSTYTASSLGYYDHAFDMNGNLLGINRLDLDSTLLVKNLTIDKNSNKLYALGVRNTGMFPLMTTHPFLAAFDLSRSNIWFDTLANPLYPSSCAFGGIAADNRGHIYVTPNSARVFIYKGDTTWNNFGPSAAALTAVMKLDTAGNKIWIRKYLCNSGVNSLNHIVTLPNGKVATGGVMAYSIVCTTDTMTVYPGEGQNAFFTILDTAGYVQEFRQVHGIGFYDGIHTCAADRKGNLYLGGQVENNIWGGSIAPYTSVGGNTDFFIMKYGVDCGCSSWPVAAYNYSGIGLSRSFNYTGTTVGIDSLRWYFGDGTTATGFTPTHTYAYADTYTVCVRVYSSCGNDMHCKELVVQCLSPTVASFTAIGAGPSKSFTFTGTSTGIDSVRWHFGDGTSSTLLNPTHSWGFDDTFTVCVTVYTNCGSATSCQDYIIYCAGAILPSFTDTGSAVHGFLYTGTTTYYDSVVWHFGDGSSDTGRNTVHTYTATGTYHVCARIYTDCGTEEICRDIFVIVTTVNVTSVNGQLQNIQAYPNPSAGNIIITGITRPTTYQLHNAVGHTVAEGTMAAGPNQLNIAPLPPGIYLLEMQTPTGQRVVLRVMKQ